MAQGKKNKSYHHGDLPKALMAAAFEIAKKEGTQGLTLRKVAKQAGVSHTAPYSHYKDKSTLLSAMKNEAFLRLNELFQQTMSCEHDPLRRLKLLGKVFVEFAKKEPAYFDVMFRLPLPELAIDEPAIRTGKEIFRRLKQAVESALRTNGQNRSSVDTLSLASWALLHGVISLWCDGPLRHIRSSEKLEQVVEEVLEAWLQLITTSGGVLKH